MRPLGYYAASRGRSLKSCSVESEPLRLRTCVQTLQSVLKSHTTSHCTDLFQHGESTVTKECSVYFM